MNASTPPHAAAAAAQAAAATTWTPPVVTKKQVNYATWVCFFAWVFAVYDFILFGTLLPRLGDHFKWTADQQTNLNTWVTLGTVIVAFGIGPIADKLGRRKGIIIAVAGAALCSGLTAFAGWVIGVSAGVGFVLLILVRSLAGLGYAEQSINATYLSELFSLVHTDPAATKRRGFIYSLVQGGWPVGAVLTAVLVAALYPLGERWFGPGGGWALSFVFAMFPAVVIAILGRRLVETPQFLTSKRIAQLQHEGRTDEAQRLAHAQGVDLAARHHTGISAMFKGVSLRPTLSLALAFFLNWFAIVIFAVLGTSVLGGSGGTPGKGIDFSNALQVLILSNLAGFLGYMFHGWLGDRIGRRTAVAIGWVLGGMAFYMMLQAPQGDFWRIVPLYSLGLFFLIGPYAAVLFLVGESFPSHIRATAGSFVNAMGQVGAIAAGFGVTYTLSHGADWVQAAVYWGAVPCIISGVVMMLVPHVDPKSVK
ncbi:MFS transporter [Variovorax paradoxus]|uniref:Major facilitator superfamily MFS_1 n=1 Tax=Variovorax paradoxus (strain EPS) TaxID=595537 RepID=E6V1T1_VARPE|nr:MFS transporter [Variovorax paradoxus]ADU36837.1 major facilitator superfamily MFS_1 [Variovorax paradoxus EPS]